MSAKYNLILGEAELGEESDDESFDEEIGDIRRKSKGANGASGGLDDSSEEEDDDDDEEAARQVRTSFTPTPPLPFPLCADPRSP